MEKWRYLSIQIRGQLHQITWLLLIVLTQESQKSCDNEGPQFYPAIDNPN